MLMLANGTLFIYLDMGMGFACPLTYCSSYCRLQEGGAGWCGLMELTLERTNHFMLFITVHFADRLCEHTTGAGGESAPS